MSQSHGIKGLNAPGACCSPCLEVPQPIHLEGCPHLPQVLPQVLADFRPNLLAAYLYDLASTFHGFFEACPVLKSEGEIRAESSAKANVSRAASTSASVSWSGS